MVLTRSQAKSAANADLPPSENRGQRPPQPAQPSRGERSGPIRARRKVNSASVSSTDMEAEATGNKDTVPGGESSVPEVTVDRLEWTSNPLYGERLQHFVISHRPNGLIDWNGVLKSWNSDSALPQLRNFFRLKAQWALLASKEPSLSVPPPASLRGFWTPDCIQNLSRVVSRVAAVSRRSGGTPWSLVLERWNSTYPDSQIDKARSLQNAWERYVKPSGPSGLAQWSEDLIGRLLDIHQAVCSLPERQHLHPSRRPSWKLILEKWLSDPARPRWSEKQLQDAYSRYKERVITRPSVTLPPPPPPPPSTTGRPPHADPLIPEIGPESLRLSPLYCTLYPAAQKATLLAMDPSFSRPSTKHSGPRPSDQDLAVLNRLTADLCGEFVPSAADHLYASVAVLHGVATAFLNHRPAKTTVSKWESDLLTAIQRLQQQLRRLRSVYHTVFVLQCRRPPKDLVRAFGGEFPGSQGGFNARNLRTKIFWLTDRKSLHHQSLLTAKARQQRRTLNDLFVYDQRKVFARLNTTTAPSATPLTSTAPTPATVQAFWSDLWEKPEPEVDCSKLPWVQETLPDLPTARPVTVNCPALTPLSLAKALQGKRNWGAPGPDGVCTYWLKYLSGSWEYILPVFQTYLHGAPLPQSFAAGITFRLSKTPGALPVEPEVRPITCVNNIYKVYTSMLNGALYAFLNGNHLLTPEQRGARDGIWGTYENLITDHILSRHATELHRTMIKLWFDIAKAFDSVRHRFLLWCLQILGVPKWLIQAITQLTQAWNTRIRVGKEFTGIIRIISGIFQGDTLCPLLFIVAMNLASWYFRCASGYCLTDSLKVTHLLFIDDLLLYLQGKGAHQDAIRQINMVRTVFGSIGFSTNIRKSGSVLLVVFSLTTGDPLS